MSTDTIIALSAALAQIAIFLVGVGSLIYKQGTAAATVAGQFKALEIQTTERFKSLTERFDLAHSQNNHEINELRSAVSRMSTDVASLREDRVRLNRIEEEVRELRREQMTHRAPA